MSARSELYGREMELERARALLSRAAAGQGGLLLFSGEPGIGKSRLLDAVASLAPEHGVATAWGRCWEAGGAPPYWPWMQAFRALDLDDRIAQQEDRFLALDGAARRLIDRARSGPLLLLLDDLHASDVPSLMLLLMVARALRSAPVMIAGAYREAEVRSSNEVGPLIAKIEREAEVLPLSRLSREDLARWIERASAPIDAAEVYSASEGNPLFVESILRVGSVRAAERHGLTAVLDEQLALLSPAARSWLECASVLGRELAPDEAGALAAMEGDTLEAALKEAIRAGVTERREPGLCAFTHVLLRDRVYDGLPPSRRAELHVRAGRRLRERGADRIAAAHHLIEGEAPELAEAALEAATHALATLAFEEAAGIAERALAKLQRPPLALQLAHAEARMRAGNLARGRALCLETIAAAREAGDDEIVARAALAYSMEVTTGRVDPKMVELLQDAKSRIGETDHPLVARVMARLAAAMTPTFDEARGRETLALARRAREMAARLGDPRTQLYVAQFAVLAMGYQVGSAERGAIYREIVTLALALDDTPVLAMAAPYYAVSLLEQSRRADADAVLRAYEARLGDLPLPHYLWRLPILKATYTMLDGDLDAGAELLEEAHRIARTVESPPALLSWAVSRMALAIGSGDPSSIADCAPQLFDLMGANPSLSTALVWVLAATGRRQEALERLRQLLETRLFYPQLTIASETCLLLGAREHAGALYDGLARFAPQNPLLWSVGGGFPVGPTPRLLGGLALLLGRREEAIQHLSEAIEMCERMGAKPLLALCRRALADAEGGSAKPKEEPAGRVSISVRHEGELFVLESSIAPPIRLKSSKGLSYLELLLAEPGREVHVLEIVGALEVASDSGAVLDARAKQEYRRRLDELAEALADAERLGDSARAARAQEEIDAIADELASAVGLGGRDRKAASNVERARVNVQRRMKDALDRITRANPALGRYLAATVRTGTFCRYCPL